MSKTFTVDELTALLKEWQAILRMQDWDFDVSIRRAYDMSSSNWQGECKWTLSKKRVSIRIVDPVDYDPAIVDPQDMEVTLVHEMLHPLFAQFKSDESDKDNSLEGIALEQTIDCLSVALVNLKRKGDLLGEAKEATCTSPCRYYSNAEKENGVNEP